MGVRLVCTINPHLAVGAISKHARHIVLKKTPHVFKDAGC